LLTASFSILALVAALTLAFFLGILNFAFWRVQRDDPTSLWMMGWMAACAVMAFCRLLQYAPLSDDWYVLVPRFLLTVIYMLVWLGYEITNSFLNAPPKPRERLLFITIVAVPILLLWASNLILTDEIVIRTVAFGGTYHGVQSGILYLPVGFLLLVIGSIQPIRLFQAQAPHRRENILMGVGFLFVILCNVNDALVFALNLTWIRLSDFSYLLVAIFFSYIQVQRYGLLYRDMNLRVQERTANLSQANESLRAEISVRELAQAALQDSEERYRLLFETNPHPMWVYDLETLVFVMVNDAAVEKYGYTRDEFLRMTIKDIRPADELPALMENLAQERRAYEWSGPWQHVNKAGEHFFVEVLSHDFPFDGRPARLVLANDVSERKQAADEINRLYQEARQQARELEVLNKIGQILTGTHDLDAIVEQLGTGARQLLRTENISVIIYDDKKGSLEGSFYLDRKMRKEPFSMPIGEGLTSVVVKEKKAILAADYLTECQKRGIEPSGEAAQAWLCVPIVGDEKVLGALTAWDYEKAGSFDQQDLQILSTLAAQAAIAIHNAQLFDSLRTSEQKFFSAFHTTPDAITINRLSDGIYLEINAGFSAMTGYSAEEVKGKAPAELGIWDDPAFEDHLVRELAAQGEVINLDLAFCRKDHQTRVGLLSARTMQIESEMCILSITRDITELKLAEAEILRKAEEMTALHETTHDLVIEQKLSELLKTIVERAVDLLKTSGGGLYLCDPKQRQARCVVSYQTLRDYTGVVLKYGEGAAGRVAEIGEPLVVEDYRTWEGRADVFEQDQPFRSILTVPMRWREQVIGVIHVIENTQARVFTPQDVRILTLFANQAAIAIENSRLLEFEQRRRQEAAAIIEVGRDISASLQLDVVLERIAMHARNLLHSVTSAVYLAEQSSPVMNAIAAIGPDAEEIKQDPLQIGEGILGNIAQQKEGEIVNDSINDPRGITIKGTENIATEHLMGVPILSRGRLSGLIAVWREGEGNEFTTEDLDFLTSLAQQVAIAIENARLFEDTRLRLTELEILQRIASALRMAQTPDQAFPIILDQLISVLNFGSACIEMVEPDGSEIVTVAAEGAWRASNGFRTKVNEGVSGYVISTGKAYLTTDVLADGMIVQPELLAGFNVVACVPIIAQHHPIGTLWVGRKGSLPITIEEVNLLMALGEMVGNTIQRMKLHTQTVVQAEEIAQAYDKTLEGWARALELRDKETEGHSRRVSELTQQLALKVGIPPAEMAQIHRGVLLHDIGKMGVPDQVLKKAGPLDYDDWVEMKKHPQYAYDLLSPINYLRPALDIPYCHHERWDGRGYPRGLKAEQIPLAARIFAVVDIYDALSHDRPYREAWPIRKVLKYLHEQAGKHLDPKIVEIFLQMVENG
jgi:PAS domain S-box-containing protein